MVVYEALVCMDEMMSHDKLPGIGNEDVSRIDHLLTLKIGRLSISTPALEANADDVALHSAEGTGSHACRCRWPLGWVDGI